MKRAFKAECKEIMGIQANKKFLDQLKDMAMDMDRIDNVSHTHRAREAAAFANERIHNLVKLRNFLNQVVEAGEALKMLGLIDED